MLETASREIRQAAEAEERRRQEAGRLPGLVSALDDLLFELEELVLQDVAVAPARCRRRAAELIAEASRLDELPVLPETVAHLMDRVYEAQDIAMLRRRRAGWGLE
ncbi:MAG TPA: hypothetical protein VLW53_01525 [Candidatus Eisenbacteria bacterium]|nr:hypothetical protein [Candidatus Eisenbacteria bacterium]